MKIVLTTYLILFTFFLFCSGQSLDGKPRVEADPYVKEFLSQLDADDPEEVESALGTVSTLGYLGQVNRQKVEKRLVDLLEAPSTKVRIASAYALNAMDGPLERALQVLIEVAVKPPTILARRGGKRVSADSDATSAIWNLGIFRERAAICVPTLIKLLRSEDIGVHIASIDALGRIGNAASVAVPALARDLLDTQAFGDDGSGDCPSAHAAEALGLIGPTAFPILEEALRHPEPSIRARAANAMSTVLEKEMSTILEKESWSASVAATLLLPSLNDSDANVRAAAAKALGNLPQSADKLIEPLSQLLSDSQPLVRIEAASALGKLGTLANTVTPKLVPLLFDKSFHNYAEGPLSCFRDTRSVCDAAYRALLSIQPDADQVVPGLVSAFEQGRVLTDQSILMLCEYKRESHAAKEPLERFLTIKNPVLEEGTETKEGEYEEDSNLAACGLAMLDPLNPKIRPILEPTLFKGIFIVNRLDHLALIQLVTEGVEFDEEFRLRVLEDAEKFVVPAFWVCLLRWEPDNQRAAKAVVSALGELLLRGELLLHSEAERALRDLAHHKQVQQILLDTARDPTALKLTRERASEILRFAKAVIGKQ